MMQMYLCKLQVMGGMNLHIDVDLFLANIFFVWRHPSVVSPTDDYTLNNLRTQGILHVPLSSISPFEICFFYVNTMLLKIACLNTKGFSHLGVTKWFSHTDLLATMWRVVATNLYALCTLLTTHRDVF